MAFMGMGTTFRTLGQAGAITNPQCVFTIENLAGSSVTVVIRRLVIQMDATAALAAVMPQLKTCRFATPGTGGTTLTKAKLDTTQASSTLVQIRGGTASDGGTAVTLTVTAGTYCWQQYGMRLHTAVGQVLAPDSDMMPVLIATPTYYMKLAPGEGLACQIVTAVTTSNPATNHYFVNCVWDEAP
jgi:hypothetical protein